MANGKVVVAKKLPNKTKKYTEEEWQKMQNELNRFNEQSGQGLRGGIAMTNGSKMPETEAEYHESYGKSSGSGTSNGNTGENTTVASAMDVDFVQEQGGRNSKRVKARIKKESDKPSVNNKVIKGDDKKKGGGGNKKKG